MNNTEKAREILKGNTRPWNWHFEEYQKLKVENSSIQSEWQRTTETLKFILLALICTIAIMTSWCLYE